jgi:hypothetical protein
MPFVREEDVLAARPQVRYAVTVRFHEDDLDRVRELVLAAPADHLLTLLDQDEAIIRGIWAFDAPAGHYVAVKKLLARGGFRIVQIVFFVEPGAVFVAPRGKVIPDWARGGNGHA